MIKHQRLLQLIKDWRETSEGIKIKKKMDFLEAKLASALPEEKKKFWKEQNKWLIKECEMVQKYVERQENEEARENYQQLIVE